MSDKTNIVTQDGLETYLEIYFEVVSCIAEELLEVKKKSAVWNRYQEQGRGGVYELAKELTDKFDQKNRDRVWDGDFFDEIENFLAEELSI